VSFSVEYTAVLTGVLQDDVTQRFLVASPTVGLVTNIWNSSLSTTLLVVPADTAARRLARENCITPLFWVHWPTTDIPARLPVNPVDPVPPLKKVIAADELSKVDVPVSPDIVIVGEHARISGTVLCRPIVIVFAAQGKGALWTINVYMRAGIT
jgi:hypothetical protein